MAIVTTDNAHYRDIAAAIREKAGGTALYKPTEMAAAIRAIQTGSGGGATSSVDLKDVNFYDYDGTPVASYTLAEAQALTALPDGPTHDGLVFQGWNWPLEKINALTRPMNVGAMYITDDGKTRLHIRVWDTARSNVPLWFSQTLANGVTIDWGDGSATETLAGTGNVNTTHQYTAAGYYTITLDPAEGCKLGLGASSSSYCVMGSTGNNGKVYCNLLQDVKIGSNVTSIRDYAFRYCFSLASVTIPDGVTAIGGYAFGYCYSLTSVTIPSSVIGFDTYAFGYCHSLASITIPDGVNAIGSYAFYNCNSLASVTIPDSVTSISTYALYYCYSLASITIPDGITDIGSNVFYNCNSLASITIPSSVTKIYSGAFQNCYGMAEYHLKPTTPPTLSNTNAFNKIPSDCVFYVPQGCLEAYQTATNWATYASYMQEEPA